MAVEAEQLLHADRKLGPLLRLVVDGHRRARRRGEVGGSLTVEPAAQRPRQQALQGVREVIAREFAERGLAGERGREPIDRGRGKRCIRQVGPFIAFGPAQEHDAIAPLPQRLRPWQPLDAEPGGALREQAGARIVRRHRQRLLGERDGAEAAQPARAQARARAVEGDVVAALDAIGELRLDLG